MTYFAFTLPHWITTIDTSKTAQMRMSYADQPRGLYFVKDNFFPSLVFIRVDYPAGQDEEIEIEPKPKLSTRYDRLAGHGEDVEELEVGTMSGTVGLGKHSRRLLWIQVPEFGLWSGTINVLERDHAKVIGHKMNYRAVGYGLGQYERSDMLIGIDAHLTRLHHYWKMYYSQREAMAADLMIHLGFAARHLNVEAPQLIQHFHDTEGSAITHIHHELDQPFVDKTIAMAREFIEIFKGVHRLREAGLAAGSAKMNRPKLPRTLILGGDSQATTLPIEILYQGITFQVGQEDGGYHVRIATNQVHPFEQTVNSIAEAVDIIIRERCSKS